MTHLIRSHDLGRALMRWGVVVFPGSLDDRDALRALGRFQEANAAFRLAATTAPGDPAI